MATVLPFDAAGIHLDPAQGLARQLYAALRERILDGRLGSRTRMPASRELAQAPKVSRNTVVRAYEQLHAEGYIDGRTGDGTYVAELQEIPGRAPAVAPSAPAPRGPAALAPPPEGAPRAFRVGVPAFDLFPFDTWARLQARFWRNPPADCLGYGDPAGEARLRELIAAYLRSARGLRCEAEQVIVTHGAQQAIRLCAQVLLENGDPVAVENPGYRAARLAFAATGAVPHGIDLDAEGLRSDRLAGIAGCRLAYVTPSHQYPTGVTLSLARRLELLEWAERADGWIVEDDYDGEYRYSGTPLAPLAALDRQGRVLYVGTFCKIAFPALRLGYLVVPPALVERFASGGPSRYAIRRWAPSGSWPTSSPRGISSATSAACAAPPAPAATPCCGLARGAGLPAVAGGGGGAAPVRAGRQPGARAGPDRRGGSRRGGSQRLERLLDGRLQRCARRPRGPGAGLRGSTRGAYRRGAAGVAQGLAAGGPGWTRRRD